jgi:hypothetical protein
MAPATMTGLGVPPAEQVFAAMLHGGGDKDKFLP